VEAEQLMVEAEAPVGALLDGAGGGRGNARLGLVEDGVLLDRALAGASKYWCQPGRQSPGRGGGRGRGGARGRRPAAGAGRRTWAVAERRGSRRRGQEMRRQCELASGGAWV
jgi:hypothetical protein